jgi:NADH-quinone oxidoreductase subunit C
MEPTAIRELLEAELPGAVLGGRLDDFSPWLEIDPPRLREVCALLKGDERLACNQLMCLSGLDLGEGRLASVIHLFSLRQRHKIALRCTVSREQPRLPSVADFWPTADWHEREAYDMLGLVYEGHPDLRRILCPDDWEGYPLRKDYQTPATYNGMPLD